MNLAAYSRRGINSAAMDDSDFDYGTPAKDWDQWPTSAASVGGIAKAFYSPTGTTVTILVMTEGKPGWEPMPLMRIARKSWHSLYAGSGFPYQVAYAFQSESAGVPSCADLEALFDATLRAPESDRGVFAPRHVRPSILTRTMVIETAKLPRWRPRIHLDRRATAEND